MKKDYYRILNIKSSASPGEIKNAYRKLAMKYHPDRNPDDAIAAAVFTDAAEAHKILSDREARKQYNYERHLIAEREYIKPLETLDKLIMRMQKINEFLIDTDPFRFNKDALLYSIKQIFPDDMSLLANTNDPLMKQLLEKINFAAKRLSTHQTKQLILLLQPFYQKHAWLQQQLNISLKQQQKEESWEKNKIVLAMLVAVILCIMIFLSAAK